MNLSNLKKIKGNKKQRKRRGRGYGSGIGGHTTGTGTKGQNSRAGNSKPFAFEGGQVPLYKKLPKIGGFKNPAKKDVVAVTINKFNVFKEGSEITPKNLVEKGILNKLPKHGVKILNTGTLGKKLTFKGFLVSKGAKEQIEQVGGSLI